MESEVKNLVIILGPTAAGKSRTGLKLAGRFNGEIINCDSMQVYPGFDIGTDKPSRKEREAVPHHLIDVVDPAVQFTAADFVSGALKAIEDVRTRRRLPLIVGGTGLYIKALVDGLFPGPGRDAGIRKKLEAEAAEHGLDRLFQRLEEIDPDYARKVRSRDRIRIIRALEVHSSTGVPFSSHFAKTSSFIKDFHCLRIGLQLERKELYRRIEDRVDRMFAAGIVEEVRGLLEQGVSDEAPPFKALGYKWVLRLVKNEITREEAVARTKLDTRHYAKRQITWFKKMTGIAWFSADDYESVETHVQMNLK